jgi:hypothetical protein
VSAEAGVYRRALVVVAIAGVVVGGFGTGLAGMVAGSEAALAAGLGALLGIAVAVVGPAAMVMGHGKTPAGLAGTVAAGWAIALAIAFTGLALARGLEDERRIALGLAFAAVVLGGLVTKAIVTAKGRVPYVEPTADR